MKIKENLEELEPVINVLDELGFEHKITKGGYFRFAIGDEWADGSLETDLLSVITALKNSSYTHAVIYSLWLENWAKRDEKERKKIDMTRSFLEAVEVHNKLEKLKVRAENLYKDRFQ